MSAPRLALSGRGRLGLAFVEGELRGDRAAEGPGRGWEVLVDGGGGLNDGRERLDVHLLALPVLAAEPPLAGGLGLDLDGLGLGSVDVPCGGGRSGRGVAGTMMRYSHPMLRIAILNFSQVQR